MNVQQVIRNAQVKTGATPQNKDDAIKMTAELLAASSSAHGVNATNLFTRMLAREDIGSTGFGGGIAIPHCAHDDVDDFIVAILAVPQGVDFKSMDGKPVKLIVGIVAPTARRNQHIHLLSAVSSVLRRTALVEQMLAIQDPDKLRALFAEQTSVGRKDKPEKQRDRNLVHIFTQHEDRFEEILGMLTETPDCSISVIEADNADRYLHAMPLFASFWSGADRGFHRIVTALVDAKLTNDLVRRVNGMIDETGEGVMVVVLGTVYANGSLGL